MKIDDFKIMRKVWVNAPSTKQPYHSLDGKVGIAVRIGNDVHIGFISDGPFMTMRIDPFYLDIYVTD